LLHKLSIRSTSGTEKLLKVIQNPVTAHLPPNCRRIVLSGDAPTVRLSSWVRTLPKDEPVCIVVGAFARGKDDFADAYCDEKIGVSEYPLSASVACGKVCCAFEDVFGII
jgi:rRNA small subunit pseudouridine methyltransferase Nep1